MEIKMSSNNLTTYGYGSEGYSKGICEDCGHYSSKLSEYDDSFQLENGSVDYGYHNGWKICMTCANRHDFTNEQLMIEIAKEREQERLYNMEEL